MDGTMNPRSVTLQLNSLDESMQRMEPYEVSRGAAPPDAIPNYKPDIFAYKGTVQAPWKSEQTHSYSHPKVRQDFGTPTPPIPSPTWWQAPLHATRLLSTPEQLACPLTASHMQCSFLQYIACVTCLHQDTHVTLEPSTRHISPTSRTASTTQVTLEPSTRAALVLALPCTAGAHVQRTVRTPLTVPSCR